MFHWIVIPVFAKITSVPNFAPRAYFGMKNCATDAEKHGESKFTAKHVPKPLKKINFQKTEISFFRNSRMFRNIENYNKSRSSGADVIFANTGRMWGVGSGRPPEPPGNLFGAIEWNLFGTGSGGGR